MKCVFCGAKVILKVMEENRWKCDVCNSRKTWTGRISKEDEWLDKFVDGRGSSWPGNTQTFVIPYGCLFVVKESEA